MTREEAIKILQKLYEGCNKHKNTDLMKEAYNLAIEALKAQADLQPNCNELATDCISRQDAIDAPVKMVSEGIEWIPVYHLKSLPSAQPEVIRCKDCKWCEDADGLMCKNTASWVVATENDFGCILAERRTDG